MNKKVALSLILSLPGFIYSFTANAAKTDNLFKFHYKNLNTLGALLCSLDAPTKNVLKNTVRLNRFDSDKKNLGNSERIEFSGICNAEVSINTKEVLNFGQNFGLDFSTSSLKIIRGKLGIKEISIYFNNKRPSLIKILDPFTKSQKRFDLSQVKWAAKNSIVSFSENDLISIKSKDRIIATENDSKISLRRSDFYNLWNFTSFGCESFDHNLAQEKCQELSELL